jgi:hypothetical protein
MLNADGQVCHYKPFDEARKAEGWNGTLHGMIMNDGDLSGDDWVVIE